MYELDAFEKHYITGEGEVFFRDKMPLPSYLLPMLLLGSLSFCVAVLATLGPFMGAPFMLLALFGIVANLALVGYRLVVSDAGVEAYVGVRSKKIPFERIERMEIVEAGLSSYPLGRGFIRRGKGGIGYMPGLGPFRGVRIHMRGQRSHIFLASNQPERLVEAIQKGMARAQGGDVQEGVVLGLDANASTDEGVSLTREAHQDATSTTHHKA